MARENQGLQIALIIFVMLTIILGVTTYLFFRQYEEAATKAKGSLDETQKQKKLAETNEGDVKQLKRLIFGIEAKENVDTIASTMFGEDMKKYGGAYPEESRFYRPLLEKMSKTIDEKNTALVLAATQLQEVNDKLTSLEASKKPQIDKFKQESERAGKDLEDERSKFKTHRDRLTEEEAGVKAKLDAALKEAAASLDAANKKVDDVATQYKRLKDNNQKLAGQLESVLSEKVDIPNGEILWANQRAGTVWINLGRADALQRQITFSVYPADIAEIAGGGKKASIEITQILGDHLAEARISDDRLVDPIIPGDKIFTPVWTPGEKRHFALAGIMDLDGDGKSDLQTLIGLINMNGGTVDGYVDEKGKRFGEINVNTRYLVLGEQPTEKSDAAMRNAVTRVVGDADRLGVQTIQLDDMLRRMGWKSQASIVQFGRGANPKNFTLKPQEGTQKKSTGGGSDVFKPRQPPIRIPIGG